MVSFYATKSLLLLLESGSETEYPPQEQDFPNDRDIFWFDTNVKAGSVPSSQRQTSSSSLSVRPIQK